MKSSILFSAWWCLLFASIGTLSAQTVTWQQVGTLPTVDLLSDKLSAGFNGTIFLSNGNRSDDLGKTWTPMSFMPKVVEIGPDGALIFGTEGGIRRSIDNGETWEMVSSDLQDRAIDNLMIITATHWVARSGRTFFRSDDGGETWTETGIFPTEYIIGAGALEDGTLMCAAEFPTEFGAGDDANDSTGVYRSVDGGATWQQTTFSPALITEGKLMVMRSFAVEKGGVILVGFQGLEGVGNIYRSTNRGESWASTTLHDVVTTIIHASDGTWFASAVNSGVYRSIDGGKTWTAINAGLHDYRIFPMTLNSDGILFAADVFSTFYRTTAPVILPASVNSDKGTPFSAEIIPNPARETARLAFRGEDGRSIRATILDPTGRVVRTFSASADVKGEGEFSLDLTSLSAGFYHVLLESEGRSVVLPWVVLP